MYDLYWSTMGGGEQVDGSIAQVLAGDHDVTLLGPHPVDVDATFRRLGVDLSACGHRRVVDDQEASEASADFDVFVNGTYLSKSINRAPIGYYYVHFPGEVPTRADLARSRMGVAGVKALSLAPKLPQRLTEVQAAFDRRVRRVEFVPTYTRYLANSEFTAGWIRTLWNAPTDVLYPPVRPSVRPGDQGAADPRARPVLRPEVRSQQEAARTARDVPWPASRRSPPRLAHGDRRRLRRGQPRLRPGRAASGAGTAGRRARQRAGRARRGTARVGVDLLARRRAR